MHASPTHIVTPTGSWDFFKKLDLGARTAEREAQAEVKFQSSPEATIIEFNRTSLGSDGLMSRFMTLVPEDLHTSVHKERLTGGLLIRVQGREPNPVLIDHEFRRDAYRHTIIVLEPNAECVIIETMRGDAGVASHIVEAFLGENAHLTYISIQRTAGEALLLRKAATLGRDASITWFELSASTGMTFCRTEGRLDGENAAMKALSIFLGRGEDRIDLGAAAQHLAPQTTSSLLTKGVLSGEAQAVYEGQLRIGTHAEKSVAFQREDCLLLSERAQVRASPMLFIDNNDVQCSHASSAGRPDAEKLFYLQARGLSDAQAKRLLVKAFVWPVLEALGHGREEAATRTERVVKEFLGGDDDA
jgi:Fe-S cluster assembly protein SufD